MVSIRAAVYLRISSDQEGQKLGVSRQREDCLKLCHDRSYEPVVFEENDTGASVYSKKKRPVYADLIKRARQGEFQVIVAYSNSRLTRRSREFLDLLDLYSEHGVKIETVVSGQHDLSTADGRFAAKVLADADAAEAERLSERLTRSMEAKKAAGGYLGGARPFGWGRPVEVTRADGRVILSGADHHLINEREAELVRKGAQWLIAGESVAEVVRRFNASGVESLRRRGWIREAVHKLFLSDDTTKVMGDQGPILDEATAATVRGILKNPNRLTRTHGTELRYYLSGAADCGVCGRKLGSGGGTRRDLYACPDGHVAMRRPLLEKIVSASVAQWYAFGDRTLDERVTTKRTISEVNADLAALVTERDEITSDINERLVTRASQRPRLIELRDAEDALNAELADIRASDADQNLSEAAVEAAEAHLTDGLDLDNPAGAPLGKAVALRKRWNELTPEAKRRLLRANFRIVVDPGYDTSRVHVWRGPTELTAGDDL